MSTSTAELRKRLEAALSEVTAAESALEELLRDLRVAPRAQKVTITTVIETAFVRLRTARAELAKIHELMKDE